METLGKITAAIMMLSINASVKAFAIMTVWNLLLPKMWPIDAINFWQGMAVSLLIGIVKTSKREKKEEGEKKPLFNRMGETLGWMLSVYSFAIFVAWIISINL